MFGIKDDSVFTAFEDQELVDPSPRKTMDRRTVCLSRELQIPKIYRAPEVIIEAPWSYQIDIWNTGCMIWYLFQGGHLFTGHDPEHQTYRSTSLEEREVGLEGESRERFLAMIRKMLHWVASKRSSAKALADEEWILENM
ncbi:hypothetical protein D7B24_003101 [Verticillium nonalfalfae]|uniref:Protein kinase domain-containing protein n=2 Tax=Verticillium TaxID=1036719 RepID=A0A444RUW3_VERDA|nr:uncharacterized protein D7B24_003101 [Verticillium nonalfalfae]PNH42757.1 hypothetical protein VD0004_g4614 [Verticillium dahliae]PNH62191.1 hypothetical protein VD0001_g9520 [Verticillium dahliae]RNJ52680.1 hypothetical protein D7B24_003101 [Verticillium nonalfalfae]RXG44926.1 hypothetical protein VDGE_30753 [Verticillium dahliae]